jgi:hypothetical protein
MATQQASAAATTAQQTDEGGLAARLGSKIRKWKDAAKAAQDERDAAKVEIEKLQKEAKELEAKADSNQAAVERDELAAKFRTYKHREAFKAAATSAGIQNEQAIDGLWKLSEYKAETDEVDSKKLGEFIQQQKTGPLSYLFGLSPQANSIQQTFAPGGGRGMSDVMNQGLVAITKAQANDPVFMGQNAQRITQASAENRFSIID